VELRERVLFSGTKDDETKATPFDDGGSGLFEKDETSDLFGFGGGGGQDDFEDSGAGENEGGYNDPHDVPVLPVSNDLSTLLLLSTGYLIIRFIGKKIRK
jgi:hypothetical protein